jgi:membrane-bound acyltransferase YfiQ involved in biofilm formation
MTKDTRHLIVHLVLRFALFCVWLLFVTFVTTTSCIFFCQSVLQRSSVAHGETFRTVVIYSVVAVWLILQALLAFWFPAWFVRRRAKQRQ